MTELQFYTFIALLVLICFIAKMTPDSIEEGIDELIDKQKKLYMMVQDFNQRNEELKARVNNLEERMIKAGGINDSNR